MSTEGTFLSMSPKSSAGRFDHEYDDDDDDEYFASVSAFHASLEIFLLFLNLSPMIDFVFY